MATKIIKETRKRGFFGWFFLLIFIGFNLIMLSGVVLGLGAVGEMEASSGAERAGQAIGATLTIGANLFFWATGAVITGLLAFFTRGKKILIEETVETA